MKIQLKSIPTMIVSFMLILVGCGEQAKDDHSGHDHSAEQHEAVDDGHRDEEEGHSDVVLMTDAQLAAAGVVIAPLSGGEITTHIVLPAEIGLNEDSVLHVTPRVSGIVNEVHGYLGDEIEQGDLLAVIESPDLGEAKIAYLQLIQSKLIADAELARQELISENTERLLELLRGEPTPTVLRSETKELPIGINKGRLLSAYAQMKAGNANYTRETELNSKGLSTQADLLAAQERYYSAQAEYMAAFEEIEFTYRIALQESQQASMIATTSFENAERRLHLLGLSQVDVDKVIAEPDVDIAKYELTAPGRGQIVVKHLTPGEKVGTDEPVYTISDLSTVWLNISVYSEYAGAIKEGQRVVVWVGNREATGVVEYISAVVSESSRTVRARVVIPNTDRAWKPGEFVTVRVETEKAYADRVVPVEAIQSFEGHDVVFIQDDDGIEPFMITIGRRNDISVELLNSDLAIGTPVVVAKSFLMKAELGKSAAGHQH